MINIYIEKDSKHENDILSFFKDFNIKTNLKHLNEINRKDIILFLEKSEEGFYSLLKDDFILYLDKMKLNEAIDYVMENTHLLKSPIIIDTASDCNKMLNEYNHETIRMFLPRAYKKKMFESTLRRIDYFK